MRAILDTGRQQIREGKGFSHEDFWREMEEEPRKGRPKRSSKKTA